MLSAPCPLEQPPCDENWVELWQDAVVHASTWSQAVRTRIYSCKCPRKHTIHFDGEHLGLYVWSRQTIVVQESLQLLLKQMQRGQSGFGALLEGQQEAFRRAPECAVLSEETWRKASLDFFRLVGRQIMECCSICGPHPEVLLCDGIVGIANSDGGKRPGGLASSSHDFRRPFTHPSRSADGAALEKQLVAGRDYCAAGLEGGGMKRRLVLQPELRELIARVSRHRPVSEKLGQRLSEGEYLGLKGSLANDDVRLVTRFVPGDGEGPVPANTRRRLLVEQRQMVRDKNRAMLRLLEGIELEQAARGGSPRLWEHWPCEWGELLYDLGAHDSDDGVIGHSDGLAVVRELLLGRDASVEDRRQLGEHSPILRRVLDAQGGHRFPAFFMLALHHLYELTLLARGNTGYGDGMQEGWVVAALRPLGRAVALQHLSRERGPLTEAEAASLAEARTSAQDLLPGVEGSQPNALQWEAMSQLVERGLLRGRLGRDEEGNRMHPLPAGHTFRAEQDALGHYALPGWEQKRGLPRYTSFEHEDGRSRTSEEFKCATGQTVGDWDAANVPGLVKGGSKSTKRGKRPHRSRGAFVLCCTHRVISGFHFFLRGESLRDAFAVLYTRLDREELPKYVVYDNACQLRNYCMRREPAFFSDVTFVVDRFHYAKAGAEVHKCGPSNATEYYDALRWVNTSAVESVNSFLKKFRVLGWYSGLSSLMVFLPILLSGFNVDLSRVDDAKLSIAVPARLWSEAFRAVLLGR
ncbi:hypothetical protein KFL_007070070 [Klebsormidium nitens]|uniref:Uncharacterized protein n=1 Tax=Klebsormidium nitens TaxID=105231 RepID=A0A1Y1IP58_KLENI|nr:hypothetical protein KFL_007070070 [Klebsormidium nitens]|eukprot:GAQ90961.1 hypothetical protein KFL_007070070 [Klebsormidium nitens]